jgi:hypothetical protein
VYQRGGLEGLSRLLLSQFLGGQFPQFFVDERQELLRGVWIALFDGRQNAGDFTHEFKDIVELRSMSIVSLASAILLAAGPTVTLPSAFELPCA